MAVINNVDRSLSPCNKRSMKAPGAIPQARYVVALLIVLFLSAPFFFVWFSTPDDPIYGGQRLSVYLIDGNYHDALVSLGPKAGPLVQAWYLKSDSDLRERIIQFLARAKLHPKRLAIDHNEIAGRIMFKNPELAGPFIPAVSAKVLEPDRRAASRAAVLLAHIFNSVPDAKKPEIAAGCAGLPDHLLDRFEQTGEDEYALSLVAHIYRAHPPVDKAAELARISRLAAKSRYLETAVAALQ